MLRFLWTDRIMKEIMLNIDIKIKYYIRLFVFVYNPKFSCKYLTEVNTCTVHLTLWKSEFGDVCYLLWKSSVRLTADQEHSLCALYVYCILPTSLILGHTPEHHTHKLHFSLWTISNRNMVLWVSYHYKPSHNNTLTYNHNSYMT